MNRQFCIVFNKRNNSSIKREEVIAKIAGMVHDIHSVDLKAPDVSIIIEILKSICTMSIVREFHTYKKFNLESIFDSKSTSKRKEENDNRESADDNTNNKKQKMA